MDSTASGRSVPQKSRKRVFPGSSSPMETKSSSLDHNGTLNCKNKMLKQDQGGFISSAKNDVILLDSDDDVPYIDLCSDDEYVFYDDHTISPSQFNDVDHHSAMEAFDPDPIKNKSKGIKFSIGSSKSSLASFQFKRDFMKFRSSKKKPKHKLLSGPGGTSSNTQNATNHSEIIPIEDDTLNQNSKNNEKSSNVVESSSNIIKLGNNEEIIRKYRSFKKFDSVDDHSDHHFSATTSANGPPGRNWAKKIQEEWRILEKDLPDTIFVRVYESRMDLLRAVIMGADGTPYNNGLFVFDVFFPKYYPQYPPLVHYHSGGLRINPNLYNDGKVCLSLLNTWVGVKNENWRPGKSTMLQVLVSIQGLILNEKPYFNEPGYEGSSGTAHGENKSMLYNERTFVLSLKTMVYTMKAPPKHFEELVIGHFRERAQGILNTCKAYSNGVSYGCVVEEGEKKGSRGFKNDVEKYIKILVGAFKQIGVENVEEFIPPTKNLTQKIKAFFGI